MFNRIRLVLDSTSPPSLSVIAKAEGFVEAGGIQTEAGPAGCVGCVGRMGLVMVARSIVSLVHMSLMLSIPYQNFPELNLARPSNGRQDPRPSEARARGTQVCCVRIKSGPRSPFRRSIFRLRFRRGACRFSPGVEYSFLGPPRSRNDARAHSLRKQRPLKPIGSAAHAVTSTRRVMHPRVKELMSIRRSTRLADDCLRVKCRTSSRAVGVALVPESPWQPVPGSCWNEFLVVASGAVRYRSAARIVQLPRPSRYRLGCPATEAVAQAV
jgi:hypothetical protein